MRPIYNGGGYPRVEAQGASPARRLPASFPTIAALVALAAVGILFLFGRMNMGFAVSICIGLVILFGAGTILGGFA